MRRLLVVLSLALGLAVTAALAGVGTTGAGADGGGSFVAAANGLRASRGLPPLAADGALASKAQAWAQRMAAAGAVSHSSLASGAPGGWTRLGENVGAGPSAAAVGQQFEASSVHLANILAPDFTAIGVGTASAGGVVYVAEEFMAGGGSASGSGSGGRSAGARSPGRGLGGGASHDPAPGASPPPALPPPPPPPPPRLVHELARLRALDGSATRP